MLGDDEWVTQYVFKDSPARNHPRPTDDDGLSALRGRLAVHEAARYVRRNPRLPFDGDGVRHAVVKNLRDAGFAVTLSPSKGIPIHVSIATDAQWNDDVADAFHQCWSAEERWKRGGDEDE